MFDLHELTALCAPSIVKRRTQCPEKHCGVWGSGATAWDAEWASVALRHTQAAAVAAAAAMAKATAAAAIVHHFGATVAVVTAAAAAMAGSAAAAAAALSLSP